MTAQIPEWKDLQKQARDHIKEDNLYDWHEALTDEEMTYLEALLLTFAPLFYPGSIGYNKTVQPYVEEKDKEIELHKKHNVILNEALINANKEAEIFKDAMVERNEAYNNTQQQLSSFRSKLKNISVDEILKDPGIVIKLFDEHFKE